VRRSATRPAACAAATARQGIEAPQSGTKALIRTPPPLVRHRVLGPGRVASAQLLELGGVAGARLVELGCATVPNGGPYRSDRGGDVAGGQAGADPQVAHCGLRGGPTRQNLAHISAPDLVPMFRTTAEQ
jgi:hypothetical protein